METKLNNSRNSLESFIPPCLFMPKRNTLGLRNLNFLFTMYLLHTFKLIKGLFINFSEVGWGWGGGRFDVIVKMSFSPFRIEDVLIINA